MDIDEDDGYDGVCHVVWGCYPAQIQLQFFWNVGAMPSKQQIISHAFIAGAPDHNK